jgi:hypothetical protein
VPFALPADSTTCMLCTSSARHRLPQWSATEVLCKSQSTSVLKTAKHMGNHLTAPHDVLGPESQILHPVDL